MRIHGIVVAIVSLLLLTGFDSAKFDTLVENCVKLGKPRKQCICALRIFQKRVGNEFLEVAHLQVTRQTTAYTIALTSLLARDPDAEQRVVDSNAEAKRRCKD